MSEPPKQVKVYHITHIDNLASIVEAGEIISNARRIAMSIPVVNIGIVGIKDPRLRREVSCRPETKVGDYVPFNFCPRSVMLYVIFSANHPDLEYRGGQVPILHLQADFGRVVEWANKEAVPWAFTNHNARTRYTDFFCEEKDLSKINWNAVHTNNFADTAIKDAKQAEFLLYDRCPWHLIEKIGVINAAVQARVNAVLKNVKHMPCVEIEPTWYY